MGVNWAAGLIRWKPHVDGAGNIYPLNHLHPFRMPFRLPKHGGLKARDVNLHIGFSLHTFTRKILGSDDPTDFYSDNRETRAFDRERYWLSFALPKIMREIVHRPCHFAVGTTSGDLNYVTVDTSLGVDNAVFFDLKHWREEGSNVVLLVVQSSYDYGRQNGSPGKGRIGLAALVGHALRGTKPKRPP